MNAGLFFDASGCISPLNLIVDSRIVMPEVARRTQVSQRTAATEASIVGASLPPALNYGRVDVV